MTYYDLAQYLCPAYGLPFLLSSSETMQSVLCPDGWIEFRKNKHMEEFYVTDEVVGRGADTSMISSDGVNPVGTFYVQMTGNVYGAPWAARFMAVGEAYHRDCRVVIYNYDGSILNDYQEASDLHLIDHIDQITFPGGAVANDSLLLGWGGQEGYIYTRGMGLTGWKNLTDGSFGNYLIAVGVPPPPHPFPHTPVSRPPITYHE